MGGLARVCKLYGKMVCKDNTGKEVIWLYDYKQDRPRLQSEMTNLEIAESEKAKWLQIKEQIKPTQQ